VGAPTPRKALVTAVEASASFTFSRLEELDDVHIRIPASASAKPNPAAIRNIKAALNI